MSLTSEFCAALSAESQKALQPAAAHAAKRTLFNVLATAIGASRYPAIDIAVAAGTALGGAATSPVPGRRERLDAYHAAIVTGLAAHIDDFDDTYLRNVIHPGASTLATVLTLGAWRGTSGERALRAFALGVESQLRVGNAISPWHYDIGWHITGTCGVIGCAVAAAIVLELSSSQLQDAIGIAASETLGQREAFGSMTKGFHSGGAAANGMLAALLAEQGMRGPKDVLEAPGGFFAALTTQTDPSALRGIGESWTLEQNTFKPYPGGIVAHPAIDAALELQPQIGSVDAIVAMRLFCNPLVPELMGRVDPADGLEARFSAVHGVAAALCDGRVGLAQYEDARVRAADVARLRRMVQLVPNSAIRRDEARLSIELAGGRIVEAHVAHARGSLDRPLTDKELRAKAELLIEPVLPGATAPTERAVRALSEADNLDELIAAVVPQEVAAR